MKPVRDLVRWYLKRKQLLAVPADSGTTFPAAMQRLRNRKIAPRTVLDVGASDGRWTAEALPYLPEAQFLCVEAQPAHEAGLAAFAAAHPRVQFALCAAGERDGQTYFHASGLFGGVVRATPSAADCITVPVTTLDTLVTTRQLRPPYLIKLDTHGYEVPILAGAARTLAQTEALIVEVYNFPTGAPAVPFYEFCRLMADKGFRCVDLFDPLYRPYDQAFWQMDLIFLRADRPEFQHLSYT